MNRIFSSIIIALVLVSCGSEITPLDHSEQLKGEWTHEFNGIHQYVEFTPKKDKITGKKGFISGNDTTILENLSIEQKDGKWLYVFTDIESSITTEYQLSRITSTELSFENNTIEWPRIIEINNAEDNGLSLRLSGNEGSTSMKDVVFNFNQRSR